MLVISILVLGVLLILGLVFTGIVSRNITQTGRSIQRTAAGDLAEAGIRFAHYQLRYSLSAADWHPETTLPVTDAAGISRDPDALYLRPGSGFPLRNTADKVLDRGGPDGLGPYSRVNFEKGRALVRVRYAPSAFGVFSSPTGALRQPGKARNYLIIESVGRAQRFNPNDPTNLLSKGVQVTNYASQNAFRTALGELKARDLSVTETRKQIAFASIGIIESARFITNIFRVSSPAEIGSLTAASGQNLKGVDTENLGITYKETGDNNDPGVPVEITTLYGGDLLDPSGNTLAKGTGSLYSNADLVVHGRHDATLNAGLGDQWDVAGEIRAANAASSLRIQSIDPSGNTTVFNIGQQGLDSRSQTFSTQNGLIRDGINGADAGGYTRSVPYKQPPSILEVDPTNNSPIYRQMTRDSGKVVNGVNIGRFGYGSGVYVDANDVANLGDESSRETTGVVSNLIDVWLSPNRQVNPKGGGWHGPFFVPIASYLRLMPDGFIITRDTRAANQNARYWRLPNGQRTTISSVRFRTRTFVDNGKLVTYILNGIQSPTLIDLPGQQLQNNDFKQFGSRFDGILYFEGDIRVRGVIPTNQQITVVSMGTIYIDGSITKGIVGNSTNGVVVEGDSIISGPSTSMIALLAKDYICVNTTMFVGPGLNQELEPGPIEANVDMPRSVGLRFGGIETATFQVQLLNDARTRQPLANLYADANSSALIPSTLLLNHARSANSSSSGTYVSLDIMPRTYFNVSGSNPVSLLFDVAKSYEPDFNRGVSPYFPNANNVPILGLDRSGNAYPNFEVASTPLVTPTWTFANRKLSAPSNNAYGAYELAVQDETELTLRLNPPVRDATENYYLSRIAVVPLDVRIEATMYAQEGSFFVIPGPSFNTNQEDTRVNFATVAAADGLAKAQANRFARYGMPPEAPFYGEPLDVKLTIVGAVSENMPPTIAQQAEWQRKWGWLPRYLGGSTNNDGSLRTIPKQHVPNGMNISNGGQPYVPNLSINYDPSLALASADGSNPIRMTADGMWALPPLPRLPVSSTLVYFGEVNP